MFTASRFLFSSAIATVSVIGIQLAASARPAMLCGQELGSAVNVRKDPSMSDNVIGTAKAKVGDRVDTLDEGIGGDTVEWYQVQLPSGIQGWVSANYVRTGTDHVAVLQDDGVHVRSRPSTTARIDRDSYGMTGDRVVVLESIDGDDGYVWHQVRFASEVEGWVRGDLVRVLRAACN